MPADDPTKEPTNEDAARIAYELAEERIAQAKSEGWRYLTLSGDEHEYEFGEEKRSGDTRLKELTALPPGISELSMLQRLDIDKTEVADLEHLAGLTALRTLHVSQTQVADIAPIAGLTTLQILHLNDTQVAEIAPIAGLTALRSLGLNGNQVADIAPIAGLTALQTLNLDGTQVADIAPIAGLTALQELTFTETQVADIAPIAGLTALQELTLTETQVADIAPIAGLTALRFLYFWGIPACEDPEVRALSEISGRKERVAKTLAWAQARAEQAARTTLDPQSVDQRAVTEARQATEQSLGVTPRHAESDFEVPEGGTDLVETPLKGDVPDIDDPYRMRQQADRLSTLSDLARELFNDIKADQPNVPDALRRDLKRYGDEMGKPPDRLRPQYLRSRMKVFVIAQGDENIRMGLGDYALAKFEELIDEHSAVMAAFYGAQIERMRQSDEDPLLDAATPEALEEVIEDAIDLTTGDDWEHYPGLPEQLTEEMRERLALSRDTRGKLDMKPDEAQATGKDQLARDNRVMAATAGQAVGRAVEWVAKDPKVRATANLGSATGFLQALGRLLGF